MSEPTSGDAMSLRELLLSDLERHRPGGRPTLLKVFLRCFSVPGMLASVILRSQQVGCRGGRRPYLGAFLRVMSTVVVGADFGPGMHVGPGLMLAHPSGVTMGYDPLVIGANVTFAGGVTCAARYYDERMGEQQYPTICDNAVIGAHAVLLGAVRIGQNAVVGAGSVVLADVPDDAVVMGNPARRVATRDVVPEARA